MPPNDTGPLKPSGNFVSFDVGPLQARVYRDTGHLELAGPNRAGVPLATTLTFRPPDVETGGTGGIVTRTFGRVVSSTAIAGGLEVVQELGQGTVRVRLTFPFDRVLRYEVIDWGGVTPTKVFLTAGSDAAEHFYGFGERFNAFDQAGKKVHTLTLDHPGNKGDKSYKACPWFVSTRGYGFNLDSTAESDFDMRASKPDRYVVADPSGGLQFHIVYGPALTDVLTRYSLITGRPPLPPPYAFGAWISSDVWRNGGEVRYAVSEFRRRGIPMSAFVFDSPWETAYNDFTFNMTQFGKGQKFTDENGGQHEGFDSLQDMMAFFQRNGLKAICWMTPFVNVRSTAADKNDHGVQGQNLGRAANYNEGRDNGFFVRRGAPNGPPIEVDWWKGTGSPIDFTNPAAREWITGQLKGLLAKTEITTKAGTKESAVGGFKTDDGEARSSDGNIYIKDDGFYADGRTGKQMRNAYCVDYHKTIWNVLGAAGVIFARSGFTGTQAFPGCWSGDNAPNFGVENGLPGVIVAGQSAAMSGYSIWGHDVGGYLNGGFSTVSRPNLFIRWTQFGCFTPLMQMHRQVKKNAGDPNAEPFGQYPWAYGQQAEDNFRACARLHTQLFPYVYTYAKESAEKGLPIIRPLVLLHPDDPRTFGIQHTYFYGNELLVAPVIKPNENKRRLYLPRDASWIDFFTGQQHAGGQDLDWVGADPSRFPLFVKKGAIVPMLIDERVQTLCDANYVNDPAIRAHDDDNGLLLLIYPSGSSAFKVHDATEVTCQTSVGGPVALELDSIARPVVFKVFGPRPPAVTRDGIAMNEHTSPAAFAAAATGWRHDPANGGFTFVKFAHGGGITRVSL